jgi:hypothetical protein
MPDIASEAVREIGRIKAADGEEVAVGYDCDAVTVCAPRKAILGEEQREEFIRAWFTACWHAEEWAKQHGGNRDLGGSWRTEPRAGALPAASA